MLHHNIGIVLRQAKAFRAALGELEKARAIYQPTLSADPSNAWVEGMLANVYLDIGSAEEGVHSSAPADPATRRRRSYALAATTFAKLKAAGRLTADNDGIARQAEIVETLRTSGASGHGRLMGSVALLVAWGGWILLASLAI